MRQNSFLPTDKKRLKKQRKELLKRIDRIDEKLRQENAFQYPQDFEDFWEAYDHKKNKPIAWKKWKRLTKSEKQAATENARSFIESQPDWKNPCYPEKYLNHKLWRQENYERTEEDQRRNGRNGSPDLGKIDKETNEIFRGRREARTLS